MSVVIVPMIMVIAMIMAPVVVAIAPAVVIPAVGGAGTEAQG
jgi:hypothetical protein